MGVLSKQLDVKTAVIELEEVDMRTWGGFSQLS